MAGSQIVACNPAAEQLLGRRASELRGRRPASAALRGLQRLQDATGTASRLMDD
jgi:PAS domain-containing protein